MSNQVVRLITGDTIEIRTGAIQGVGPQGNQGEKGDTGDTGPQGIQGIQGDTGPMGEVLEHATMVKGTAVSISDNTATPLMLDQVLADDMDAVDNTGASTKLLLPAGNYFASAYVLFGVPAGAATGYRNIALLYGPSGSQANIAGLSIPPVTGASTALSTSGIFISTGTPAWLELKVLQTQGASISVVESRLSVARVGPGPYGPPGPEGPQGPAGPASTVPGPAGTLSATTTFADLGG